MKINVECTVNFGEENFTFHEAEIEVLDKEEGNKFLDISLKDKEVKSKMSLIISTNDLKKILEATEEGLEELAKILRAQGCSEKAIQTILRLYGKN